MKHTEKQGVAPTCFRPEKSDYMSFSLRKGGYKVCRRGADKLNEIAISCMAATEPDIEIEVLMVLRRIEPQLGSHIVDALLVHIVVERHTRVLPDASGHVDAVSTDGSTYRLDRSVGIAPRFPFVHHLTDHWPEVIGLFVYLRHVSND